MHGRERLLLLFATIVFGMAAAGCGTVGTLPIVECTGSLTVAVAGDTIPIFAWTPDCTIARLLVEEDVEERWGTETSGASLYRSPIVYGIAPPGATVEEPALPLYFGTTYRVTLWRFFSVVPESLELLGSAEFTPTDPAHPVRGSASPNP